MGLETRSADFTHRRAGLSEGVAAPAVGGFRLMPASLRQLPREQEADFEQSRSCLPSTPGCRSREPRLHLAHEALHRLEQLVDVAVTVEIDLEGIETGRFSVAQHIRSNLGGRAVPRRPLLAGRRCVARTEATAGIIPTSGQPSKPSRSHRAAPGARALDERPAFFSAYEPAATPVANLITDECLHAVNPPANVRPIRRRNRTRATM
jgi:hypothetical protein